MGVDVAGGLDAAMPEYFLDGLDGHALGSPPAGGGVAAGVGRNALDVQFLHQAGKRPAHHMMVARDAAGRRDQPLACVAVKEMLEFYMGKNTMERQGFIIDNLVIEEDLIDN